MLTVNCQSGYHRVILEVKGSMFASCIHKQTEMRQKFSDCRTAEEKYERIIALGRAAAKLSESQKIEENRVAGCQSIMYLHSTLANGVMSYEAESEALISQGLATLLVHVYSGETPEVVLKCPPQYLIDLDIASALTPSRANGLYSLHLKMKQEAIRLLTLEKAEGC